MRLARVDEALEVCERHLKSSGAFGTEIEAFLTRYVMVLMCASFEEAIEEIINERAGKSRDVALAAFVRSAVDQVFRSIKTGEIAGLLGRFGQDHKQRFQEILENNQRAATFYNNIVINRHGTAHSTGSNLTFAELVDFYSEGHAVLDAVKAAFELEAGTSVVDGASPAQPAASEEA